MLFSWSAARFFDSEESDIVQPQKANSPQATAKGNSQSNRLGEIDKGSRGEIHMKYHNLLFRRQFLLTPNRCNSLSHWQHQSLGQLHLYAHPDIELSVFGTAHGTVNMALIGYMIHPDSPKRSNIQILNDIATSTNTIEGISEYLRSLAGRFVLILSTPEDTFAFHDPCGLRTLYYTEYEGRVHFGSQPLIFEHIMPVEAGNRFLSYGESEYKKNHLEHWIPSGCSLYERIHHLVPNHYLRFSTRTQTRYWPNRNIQRRLLDDAVHEASLLLEKLIQAGNARYKLAFPLTAGWDTRTLLSACRSIAPNVFFYTLQYRRLQLESSDIRIPRKILQSLGYHHHVLDCRKSPDAEFADIYERNTPMAHLDDWGRIAYGMMEIYPSDRLCLKGNCSEICRCFYYKSGKHPPIVSSDQIIQLEKGWELLPFVRDRLSDWYKDGYPVAVDSGVDILDLFYWEHRMGSWQAQSQQEWDIVQETFSPFNHRGLLEIMLGVPPQYRCAPDYALYRKMQEALWPEVLVQPINPPETAKARLKKMLARLRSE